MTQPLQIRDPQTGRSYTCRLGEPLVVGRAARGSNPDVSCGSRRVSRRHCVLRLEPGGRLVVEDESAHGTWVDGVRVERAATAGPGSRIQLERDYALEVIQGSDPGHDEARAAVLTLVFTDVAGSLALKRELGEDEAATRLAGHRRLVRRLVAAGGGREVDDAGDGFFLVFAAPSAAVVFALELQREHAADRTLPPVRVGIHLGEVTQRPDPHKPGGVAVEGLAVDLTARLAGMARAQQILLSSLAAAAVREPQVERAVGDALVWLHHGPFVFKGAEDLPLEVDEVAFAADTRTLAPTGGPKAQQAAPREEALLSSRYRIVRELGRGGNAVVYQALDQLHDRPCAVKLLLAERALDAGAVERFRREAILGARLDHPGIVPTFDLGRWPETGEPYLAQELVDGVSMQERIDRGDLPREQGLRAVVEAARAVAHAHEHGVLHRDLKPANVLIDRDGRARLTDFGIARLLEAGHTLTASGCIVGTLGYVAPEQLVSDKRADERIDVYGLGGVLYAVLTGNAPVSGTSVPGVLVRIQRGQITPPREVEADVPEALEGVCLRALALAPADRFPSAEVFAAALEEHLDAAST